MSDWLWHLFNDPMRDNPASFVALVLTVGAPLGSLWVTDGWRHWPRHPGRRDE